MRNSIGLSPRSKLESVKTMYWIVGKIDGHIVMAMTPFRLNADADSMLSRIQLKQMKQRIGKGSSVVYSIMNQNPRKRAYQDVLDRWNDKERVKQ